jgi:hypothetical protein
MQRRLLFAAALAAASAALGTAAGAQPAPPGERIAQVIVYGNDPCPRGSGGEIIVCARRPETERYRIPEDLREAPPSPQNESWAVRAEALETVGATGIQSCSPVGPGGATGCLEQLIAQARAERRANARGANRVP